MVVLRAIGLTSCFLITGKLRRVELLGVFRRCSGEFIFIFVRAILVTSCFVQFTALCTSLYLFVEVATGCVGDRKRRFERFDWRGGRRGETYHKM